MVEYETLSDLNPILLSELLFYLTLYNQTDTQDESKHSYFICRILRGIFYFIYAEGHVYVEQNTGSNAWQTHAFPAK